jgi:MraZ protein
VASFKGEYENTIDSKGRVSFPAKLRKYLSPSAQDRFTIVRGLEKCLYLYPEDHWQAVEESLEEINRFSLEGRKLKRSFLRTAEDVILDNQNRIALPSKLMEWCGITGKAVFIGSGDLIEIWDPEQLVKEDEDLDFDTYQELFQKVMGGQKDT